MQHFVELLPVVHSPQAPTKFRLECVLSTPATAFVNEREIVPTCEIPGWNKIIPMAARQAASQPSVILIPRMLSQRLGSTRTQSASRRSMITDQALAYCEKTKTVCLYPAHNARGGFAFVRRATHAGSFCTICRFTNV